MDIYLRYRKLTQIKTRHSGIFYTDFLKGPFWRAENEEVENGIDCGDISGGAPEKKKASIVAKKGRSTSKESSTSASSNSSKESKKPMDNARRNKILRYLKQVKAIA